jgi:hypothetical protein
MYRSLYLTVILFLSMWIIEPPEHIIHASLFLLMIYFYYCLQKLSLQPFKNTLAFISHSTSLNWIVLSHQLFYYSSRPIMILGNIFSFLVHTLSFTLDIFYLQDRHTSILNFLCPNFPLIFLNYSFDCSVHFYLNLNPFQFNEALFVLILNNYFF